jgi:hypothetical protein
VFLLSVVTGCNLSVPVDLELNVRNTLERRSCTGIRTKPLCGLGRYWLVNASINTGRSFHFMGVCRSEGRTPGRTVLSDALNVCSHVKVFHLHCYAVSLSGLQSHYLL